MKLKNSNKIIFLFFSFLLAITIVSAIELPYEKLTLNYKGTFNSTIENFPELNTFENLDFLNSYLEQDGEIIKVKTFGDGGEEKVEECLVRSRTKCGNQGMNPDGLDGLRFGSVWSNKLSHNLLYVPF